MKSTYCTRGVNYMTELKVTNDKMIAQMDD